MNGTEIILPDIPRIFTALAEWLSCMLCIMTIKRKMTGIRIFVLSVGVLFVQTFFFVITGYFKGLGWVICMILAVGMMYTFIYVCTGLHWNVVGFYCVQAFVLAEFAASLEWELYCYYYCIMDWKGLEFKAICLIVVYGIVYGISGIVQKKIITRKITEVTTKEFVSYMIIGAAIFLMSNLGFISRNTVFGGNEMIEIYNVRTIIDFGGLFILYTYYLQKAELNAQYEIKQMQNILHNQYVQYKQSQETMKLINFKYHDLKHYISALRTKEDMDKNNYLDKMEKELSEYEFQIDTGNDVLNTIIASKSMQCVQNNIVLTAVIDGALLNFMDVMDICSVFGNALDNAIECEMKISEEEKRLIRISVHSKRSFVIIRFDNYYEGELVFEEELPVTMKAESQFHGYGLKSLRHIVHKYNGEMIISTQENWFKLKILIPLN